MSTIYEILRFSRPAKKDLEGITLFSPYDRYGTGEDEYEPRAYIRLFRTDDPYAANIADSRFSVPMELPRTELDYDKMFKAMGFSEEDINNGNIHLTYGNGWHYFYSAGEKKRKINTEDMRNFEYEVPTECFAVEMEELWDSGEAYAYPDHGLVLKHFPDIDKYYSVPASNSILAKAEIPFLIFERNRGRCYIEKL